MNQTFFQNNQQRIARTLKEGVLVVSAYTALQGSKDAAFAFEQEANFWYLTGIDAPDWRLVLTNNDVWLVAPDIHSTHQVFEGSLSAEDAQRISGVDKVLSHKEGESLLLELAKQHTVVTSVGPDPRADHYDFVLNPGPVDMYRTLNQIFAQVVDCRSDLNLIRSIKQLQEIDTIRRAVGVTVDTFDCVKNKISQYNHEYQIEADFSYDFRMTGSKGHAYDPIVASGKNALTLHYTKNNDPLPKNGLVLIDAGARVNGYCADITRTYALGTPTKRQIAVHGAVEKAHHAIIALLGPEKSVKEYHEQVDDIMIEALKSLDLYKKPEDYRKYFPHAISHGLGVDVHDSLGNPTHFKAGMVLTVEPGIYIPEEGIGVRIEDDILITETGIENLSGALPTSL